MPVILAGLKSDKADPKVSRNEIELAMRNAAVNFTARCFLYVETSAKNNKFLDDLLVKACYSALIDPAKLEQQKGPALVAAQKLAQLEEMRRRAKVWTLLVTCFCNGYDVQVSAPPPSKPKTADRTSGASPISSRRADDFDSMVGKFVFV